MASPTPSRDQKLLEQLVAYSEPERQFLNRQAAEAQALLAELLSSDDEPAPPTC